MEQQKQNSKLLGKWDFVFLLGVSGGGKGTLVHNIKDWWCPDISTHSMGDIIRLKAQTDSVIKNLTDQGILINDSLAVDFFQEHALSCHLPGLMDGFPRKKEQAEHVITFMEQRGWKALVVDLYCDLEMIIGRLLARGRADDQLSIVYKRNADHKYLHPYVMDKMKERPDLFDIIHLNGNHSEPVVFTNFLTAVMRRVDVKHIKNLSFPMSTFAMESDETTVNPMITRWLCQMLRSIQEQVDLCSVKENDN